MHLKSSLAGFGKQGESVSEKNKVYTLAGHGVDLGFKLVIEEELKRPSLLECDIRGEIKKEVDWARLRVEIYDKDKPTEPATSFENDYLDIELDPVEFRHLSLPVLGIVKTPYKVQFMVVGPAETKLEVKNVSLR